MSNIYQEEIIDRSRHPRFSGALTEKTHQGEGVNATCGDEIRWEIEASNGIITKAHHICRACAICVASADIFAEQITGTSFEDAKTASREEHIERLGIPLSPVRLKCALLPLETFSLIDL